MSEWSDYKIDDIVIDYYDYRGKTPKKLGMNWGGGEIKALSANNVEQGKINFAKECYLASEALYQIWMHKGDCEKGDVIITMEAPLGNIAQIPDDKQYILSQRTLLFKTKPEIVHNDYLFYLLSDKEFQDELIKYSTGSTVVGIQQKRLAKINLKLPSLIQQRRIARILSTCDAVIEKTQTTIAKYKAIKQGMLHDLFTRGIDITTGKLRPKYEDAPELYKESKLGMVPKAWEEKTIGEVCTMKSGEGITSKSIYEIEDYPVYGGNGLRGFTSSFTHEGEYILVGRQGALCGNITRVRGKFYASEHAVVVTIENEINVDWLCQQLADRNLNQYSEASAQPGLSVNKILKLPIIKPSFDEQNKIAERLLTIDQKLNTEQSYLHKLQQIKAGLMNDLLSGKKRVSVPEEVLAAAN